MQRAARILQKIAAKGAYSVKKARENAFIPYTVNDGNWANPHGIGWWTNGFWPAAMWQMALATGDACSRVEAVRT